MGTGQNKALGAAGGVTLGSALAILVISTIWKDASPEAATALAAVLNIAFGYLGAYLPPHNPGGGS